MTEPKQTEPPRVHEIVAAFDAQKHPQRAVKCDVCGAVIQGEPAATGLLVWTRDEHRSTELPALCRQCAHAIQAAGRMFSHPSDDE